MLRDARVGAMIPTQDVARAREFYEQKLGMTAEDDTAGGALYRCGDGTSFVLFPSAGTSSGTHTQLGFEVTDIEAEAAEITARGVTLDAVEIPGATVENGIAQLPDGRACWFKDPDGNVIAIFQRTQVPAAAAT